MKFKRFSKIQIFGMVVLSLIAVRYAFFRARSESEMIAKFHQHKSEFEQIRLMLQQDKNVKTIGSNWVRPKWSKEKDLVESHELPLNVSSQRIELYRSRLRKIGFSRVDSGEDLVQLVEFGGGFTDTTWYIGYVWSKKPVSPIVKSAYSQMPRNKSRRHFTPLEGNWYIYHQR